MQKVTEVDTTVDVKDEAYQPRNDQDAFNHQLCMLSKLLIFVRAFLTYLFCDTDDPEVYRDAPVCLQLVGRPFDDEKVLPALDLSR